MPQKIFEARGFEEAYKAVLNTLVFNPEFQVESRGGKMREIQNLSLVVHCPYDRFIWDAARASNYEFAMKMFIWILNGHDDAGFLTGINPNAKKYLDDSKPDDAPRFVTAYGPRISAQMEGVISELNLREDTRRATIMILSAEDEVHRLDPNSKVEYPCCESINFSIRQGKLNCTVNMRSSNMFTTVVYDVFTMTLLQEYVLERLNVLRRRDELNRPLLEMGKYTHNCVSAHVYESDVDKIGGVGLSWNDPVMLRFPREEHEKKVPSN